MNWRNLLRVATQVGAAASAAVLPFSVILIFGQDGFRQFSSGYTIYALSLFLGTLGLDLALARLNFSVWRACTLLTITVTTVSSSLAFWPDNPIETSVKLGVILAAVSGAIGSFLTNKIYYLKNTVAINSIAHMRIATAIIGVLVLARMPNPDHGMFILLAQNLILCVAALFYARISPATSRGIIDLRMLSSHARTALASFFTFSFAGLLQAYERYLAVGIEHPSVSIYLVLSTYLSALTYVGTGMERSEYSKPQTISRIVKSFKRLSIAAFFTSAIVLSILYIRAGKQIEPGIVAVLIYCSLATSIHIACYFSAAPLVFISFSERDVGRQALTNLLVAAVPLTIITAISISGTLDAKSRVIALGLTIPTALWLSSLFRMRLAIAHIKTSK